MQMNEHAEALMTSFAHALYSVSLGGVGGRWPEPLIENTMVADFYCGSFFVERLRSALHELERKEFTNEQIAALFPHPSSLMRMPILFRSKDALGLNEEERAALLNQIATIARHCYKDDQYCANGTNILWSPEEVQEKALAAAVPATEETRELLAKIDGMLWMYTEAIFPRWHNLAHEFHGPYRVGDDMLLVKDWHDLKPDYWNFHDAFPHERIVCYEFYRDVDVTIDIHNRMETSEPLKNHITQFYVKVGERTLTSPEQLQELLKEITAVVEKAVQRLATLTPEEALRKNAEMAFYVLKPLSDELGISWKPPEECYAKMAEKQLAQKEQELYEAYKNADHSEEGLLKTFGPYDYETELF